MPKYTATYFEKQSVWIRRTVEFERDSMPHKSQLKDIIEHEQVEYPCSDDVFYGTCETIEYDFEETEIEEV